MAAKPQPFLGTVAAAVLPAVLSGAIKAAVSGALSNPPPTGNTKADIAAEVVKRLEQNPVVVNEVSAEKPYQSRVAVGSTIGMIGALLVAGDHLWTMLASGEINIAIATAELTTVWGLGYALYGRFASGLKPLFSRGA